eukprot:CAMPEP_0113888976 /NCGR_PEP_ID=MMETSP0780_2-20120614/13201_1 /TAXON_ID=652834 /ORGANISM="Palpitomonas bilix" /LENGTH=559 /DNA_ID=CAMNT_0000877945 /DNA_START=64 /DNA_END=1743 /DNA_ORIENTATION=- /assembly_acc=CAM_ASM_000599
MLGRYAFSSSQLLKAGGSSHTQMVARAFGQVFRRTLVSQSSTPTAYKLSGDHVSVDDLVRIGYDKATHLSVSDEAYSKVAKGYATLGTLLKKGKLTFGVNTGFGGFSEVHIPLEQIEKIQTNLVRSHSAGLGSPLCPERVRMIMATRLNALLKGHSGIRPQTIEYLVTAFNKGIIPYVPSKGNVAAADLVPLSHLTLGFLGHGLLADINNPVWRPAAEVLKENGLDVLSLHAKEGLALINGTAATASLAAEAVYRARNILEQGNVVAALSTETLRGTFRHFDERIHNARPHTGQIAVAKKMFSLLQYDGQASSINKSHNDCEKVQDSYTLRCIGQVHGVVHDVINFVQGLVTTEINSVTDNPIILPDEEEAISCGNVHGEYMAKALDYLAISITELANISERRIARLVDKNFSSLPDNLVMDGGVNSGFMTAHSTAASLVSANKVLCHPVSVDSIPISQSQEDHLSNGGYAAMKALEVIENVEAVVGIELLAGCQALEFLRPLQTTPPLEAVHKAVREVLPALDVDRELSPDLNSVLDLLRNGHVANAVHHYFPEEVRE